MRHFKSKALLFAAAVNLALDEAWAADETCRPEALMRVARLMLAAAYAPPEVRDALVATVSERIENASQTASPDGSGMDRRLGDAVREQLAHLLLTLRMKEPAATAALTSRLYDHLGRQAPRLGRTRTTSPRVIRAMRRPKSARDEYEG